MKLYLFIFFIYSVNSLNFFVRELYNNKRIYNKNKKKIIINIEGVICDTKNKDYINSIANYDNILKFNLLYEKGHDIHYVSSRTNTELKNWDNLTLRQFNFWCVKYTTISLIEIDYDYLIGNNCDNLY